MTIDEFWAKHYNSDSGRIDMAVNDHNEVVVWLRKTREWAYLADKNGDFRAAKGDEDMVKVVADWLNAVKADQDFLGQLLHPMFGKKLGLTNTGRWFPV